MKATERKIGIFIKNSLFEVFLQHAHDLYDKFEAIWSVATKWKRELHLIT